MKLLVLSCAALAGLASIAEAQSARPTVYTWGQDSLGSPGGDASNPFVRISASNRNGEVTALEVAKQYQALVANGEIVVGDDMAVLLQGFAITSTYTNQNLFFHPDDALGDQTIEDYWRVPWVANGLTQLDIWVNGTGASSPIEIGGDDDGFIPMYQAIQANPAAFTGLTATPAIPNPSRFHMDTEVKFTDLNELKYVEIFDSMKNDPRWGVFLQQIGEMIPGFDDDMATLFAVSGLDPSLPDATQLPNAIINRPWAKWYKGISRQAIDGALDQAFYQPVRAAWPGCQTSNYRTSSKYDNGGVESRRWRAVGGHGAPVGMGFGWDFTYEFLGSGDFGAPRIYGPFVQANHISSSETPLDASLRVLRKNLTFDIESRQSNGEGATFVTPWILLPGAIGIANFNTYITYEQSFDYYAMMKSEGIDELLVWHDPGDTVKQQIDVNWDELYNNIEYLWGSSFTSHSLPGGFSSATVNSMYMMDTTQELEFSDGGALSIGSRRLSPPSAGDYVEIQTEMQVDIAASSPSPLNEFLSDFNVIVASKITEADADMREIELSLWDNTATDWVVVSTFPLPSVPTPSSDPLRFDFERKDVGEIGTEDFLDSTGKVLTRIRWIADPRISPQGGFTVEVDLVQTSVRRPVCVGDINNDSFVDGTDLNILLSHIAPNPYDIDSDLNRDGVVDGDDTTILNDSITALAPTGECP